MTGLTPPPRRILILLAHPILEQSQVNRRLVEAAAIDGATVHDLYEAYPRFDVDVPAEQARLAAADVIVFQHPFFWYSAPALLKQWQDLVLAHGWAYGAGGLALRRKLTLHVITTGGPAAAYHRDGHHRFTMRELLLPWEQAAHVCGLRYLPPFVIHGAGPAIDDAALTAALDRYRRLLIALRDRTLDVRAARRATDLAREADSFIGVTDQPAPPREGEGR